MPQPSSQVAKTGTNVAAILGKNKTEFSAPSDTLTGLSLWHYTVTENLFFCHQQTFEEKENKVGTLHFYIL